MFGIGITELLIIAAIALLVVGPDKLPEMAQKLGRFIWDIRRSWDDVRDTVRSEMMTIQQPFDELRKAGQDAREALRKEVTGTADTLKQAADDVKASITEVAPPAVPGGTPQVSAPPAESVETSQAPQAYQPPPVAAAVATFFDLDGNPVAAPEKS